LVLATFLVAFSPSFTRCLRLTPGHDAIMSSRSLAGLPLLQLVTAIYSGFFGGGVGIIMLATLALIGLGQHPHLERR